jgi:hypothetical protein
VLHRPAKKQAHQDAVSPTPIAIVDDAAVVLNAVIAWTRHLHTTSDCLT